MSRSASTRYAGRSLIAGRSRRSSSRRRRPGCPPDALVAQDLGQRPRPVARLARQAEVLEEVPPHRQRCRAGHPVALVADEDGRIAVRPDDQERLLEARVEARQVRRGWRCARGRRRRPAGRSRARRRARAAARGGRRTSPAGISGMASGIPKSGSSTSARPWRCVIGASSPVRRRRREVRGLGRAALDDREAVRLDRQPRADLAVRPLDADLGALRRSEAEVDPAQLPAGMAATDGQLAAR